MADDRCTDTRPHGRHEHYGQPAALRRECPGVDNQGVRLVAALTAAGFTIAGQRTGQYVRLAWPDSVTRANTLVVPVGDVFADYPDALADVIAELEYAARRGEAATRALNQHRKETSA